MAAGGQALLSTRLSPGLFAAAAMRKVQKDLVAMKVVELKEELGERGEALSGNKAWLRRRLHAAIVSEYLESAAGADGGESRMSNIFVACPCGAHDFYIGQRVVGITPKAGSSCESNAESVIYAFQSLRCVPSAQVA